jgi:aspartyl-tRNA(Asn)/glutamyl-tRNA(Gln) amidotransferase subunit C
MSAPGKPPDSPPATSTDSATVPDSPSGAERSSPRIDRARVEHVAKLASLSLTPEEAERLTHDLAAIVGYVQELDTLDTRDVPPTSHVQLGASPLRADTPLPSLGHDEALAAAPRKDHGGFAVPTFVES